MTTGLMDKNKKSYQKPESSSVHRLVASRAENNPEASAILAPGRSALTYGGLLDQVKKTVETLRAAGVNRNDKVAVVLPNGPEMAVSFVAVAAGATCAPLNPAYRVNEFDFYMSDLNARALIVLAGQDTPAREAAQERGIPILELGPAAEGPAGLFDLSGEANRDASSDGFAEPDDVGLVLHTSGTTSRPKIVPLTQINICSSAHNITVTLGLSERDRCLNVMPLFHIHGLMGAVLSSFTAGAEIVCTPGFDANRFFEWMDSFQPTWYTAVPTMHQAVLARVAENREIISRCPIRFLRSSSASLPPAVMEELEKAFDAPMIESYGMTEAAHQMASNPLPPAKRKPGSVGLSAGPEVAIMDEKGELLPPGTIGEIVIRGPNVTLGYENNPTANEGAYTKGWFRTGDQGRFDEEQYLFITGRIKEIINRGGEKIAPREVDEVLLDHPAVAQAVVFAVPHATLGEDVAAAVVLASGATASPGEIREFAASRLADIKVPTQVVIVDEIPKGPTGKLQRIGLADKLAEHLQADYVAARNPVEEELIEYWKKLLKLDKVGVQDNFYSLGGDSITAAQMTAELEKRHDRAIPLASFLASPTIETVARLVQEGALPGDTQAAGSPVIRDSFWRGLKNRICQLLALYAPGFKTTRVWLHRMRGVTIGDNVGIGTSAIIETAYPRLVRIGSNVTIGIRTVISGHLRDLTVGARARDVHTVQIEDDVYIGPGSIILPNVTIGKGAVVSAGSVVTRSVPPGMLVQGNPAEPVARCGISLARGVSYEEFVRHLEPIKNDRAS